MALWLLLSCAGWQREPLLADNEPGEELSGGGGTVFDTSENAYALSIRGLDREQRRAFAVGNAFFNDNWVTAPASAEGRDGLGPLFNARSCSGCHFKDGRGRPPAEGEEMLSMLLRILMQWHIVPLLVRWSRLISLVVVVKTTDVVSFDYSFPPFCFLLIYYF